MGVLDGVTKHMISQIHSQNVAHPSGCSGELQLADRLRAEARTGTLERAPQYVTVFAK
jgi:hypothetical protein